VAHFENKGEVHRCKGGYTRNPVREVWHLLQTNSTTEYLTYIYTFEVANNHTAAHKDADKDNKIANVWPKQISNPSTDRSTNTRTNLCSNRHIQLPC
jgi:hypothetical protein